MHVDLVGRWTQARGVAGFSAGRLTMFALGHGGLDEGWRRRFRLGLQLLAELGNRSPQRRVVIEKLLVLLLELGQLPAVILALGELLAQALVLLPQTAVLIPEEIVALKQWSAIHGACRLTTRQELRAQQKATGR